MTVFGVVIIPGTVQIGRHHTDKITPVLVTVSIAKFNARNFGKGIGFVGGFQRPGQQGILRDGLRRVFGVNTGRSQKKQFGHPAPVRGLDEVGLHHQVIVEKFGPVGIVGMDASHFGRRNQNISRAVLLKVGLHRRLVAGIQFAAARAKQAGIPAGLQKSTKGRADHPTGPGDQNRSILVASKAVHEPRWALRKSDWTISVTN